MKFLTSLSPIITIAISSVISYLIARNNTKNEIKKSMLSLTHQDKVLLNDAFTTLVASLDAAASIRCQDNKNAAIKAVSNFLAVSPPSFHPTLLALSDALHYKNYEEVYSLSKILLSLYSHQISCSDEKAKAKHED